MASNTQQPGSLNLDAVDRDNAQFLLDLFDTQDLNMLPQFEKNSENIIKLHELKTSVYNATKSDILQLKDAERQAKEYAAESKHRRIILSVVYFCIVPIVIQQDGPALIRYGPDSWLLTSQCHERILSPTRYTATKLQLV